MIFVICVIVGLIVGLILTYKEWGWDSLMIPYGALGMFIGLVLAFVGWLALDCTCGEKAIIETEEVEIHALVDNARYSSIVSGSVFIVQSRINEELKYNYMYKAENKGYGFAEVDADRCYLNYTKDKPYVKILRYDYDSAFLRWFLPCCFFDDYLFYVPEDSQVIDDFTIDFQ